MVLKRTKDKTSRLQIEFSDKVIPDSDAPLSAYSAITEMLENDPLKTSENRDSLPLFHRGDGTPVTGPQLLKLLRCALSAIGEEPAHYGTHSLRIGGATLAMSCPGASEYAVKMLGYWAGDSVRLYTRPTQGAMLELSKQMITTTNLDIPQFE